MAPIAFIIQVCVCYLMCVGLFGEGPADRRNRLRQLIAEVGETTLKQRKQEEEEKQKKGVRVHCYDSSAGGVKTGVNMDHIFKIF